MKTEKKRYRGSKFLLCKNSVKSLNDTSIVMPECSCRASRRLGFTLVELVIVIAIVIVLSVVSVPIYRSYVDKAKWTEGYALLGTIITAQKAYYAEFGNFLRRAESSSSTSTSYEPILGIDARGNKYFTSFLASSNIESIQSTTYFWAGIWKPAELQENGKSAFGVAYHVNSGPTYAEWDTMN